MKQTKDLNSEIEATVNPCLEAMATESTKLNVLGVKLQVNEVKEVNFDVNL